MAFRFAEYLIPKKLKVALITDDSSYGQEGAKALDRSFGQDPDSVAMRLTVPEGAPDLAPQVLRARRAGATALLVWAQPTTIAGVLSAARSSGWDVPVYTPPTGEDPLVRQQLAHHPDWVDGLTFASGRPTAEVGAGPFLTFQKRLEDRFGVQPVGVKTPDGADVVQPPDYAMYSYDFVNVLVAAIQQAGGVADRQKVLDALNQVTVAGANGDQRGFNERNHEGVVDDDVYFGTLPRNDLQTGTGRPAIPDARPHRAAALILAAAFAAAAPGAARATTVSLPWPPEVLPRTPPLAPGSAGVLPLQPRFVRRVSNKERVLVGLDADGTPNSVTVVQRSRLNRLGDYVFAIPAPVVSVLPGPGTESQPGQRTNQILWQGFSPGQRMLAAEAELRLEESAPYLPVKVRVEPRAGRTTVLIQNQTAVEASSYTGDVEPTSLTQVLARIRTAIDRNLFAEGLNVELRGRKTPVQVEIAAPLRVTGTVGAEALLGGARRPRATSRSASPSRRRSPRSRSRSAPLRSPMT